VAAGADLGARSGGEPAAAVRAAGDLIRDGSPGTPRSVSLQGNLATGAGP
jgi:hypothetical protein